MTVSTQNAAIKGLPCCLGQGGKKHRNSVWTKWKKPQNTWFSIGTCAERRGKMKRILDCTLSFRCMTESKVSA